MGLPTGDTITLNSGTFTMNGNKNASMSIVLQDNSGGTNFDSTYTMTLLDIGNYEVNFDLQDDTDDITKFFYNVTTFTAKFASKLGDGTEFGNILRQLTFSDLVKVSFTYDGNTDLFLCQKGDFEYDIINRVVSFKCYSPFKYFDAITAYDTSSYEVSTHFNASGGVITYSLVTFRDLIDVFLNTFNLSSNKVQTNYAYRKADVEAVETSGVTLENVKFVVTNSSATTGHEDVQGDSDEFVIDTHDKLRRCILQGGLSEAAIVGMMFGEAFYLRRGYNGSDTDYYSDINASDLENFGIKFHSSPVKTISVGSTGTVPPEESETINETNPQTIAITIPDFVNDSDIVDRTSEIPTPPTNLEINSPAKGWVNTPLETNPTGIVFYTQEALSIYKKVIGAVELTRFRGTIFGIDKLKPYQYIKLNTSISEFVDTTNQKVRPSKLIYNFKENKIDFEGYSI